MLTVSSGPFWRLVVEAAGPMWTAGVESSAAVRDVTLVAGPDALVVSATPLAGHLDAAWGLTVALGWLVASDEATFDGVGATIAVGALTVDAPPDVLAGVAGGQERPWWAARVVMRVG